MAREPGETEWWCGYGAYCTSEWNEQMMCDYLHRCFMPFAFISPKIVHCIVPFFSHRFIRKLFKNYFKYSHSISDSRSLTRLSFYSYNNGACMLVATNLNMIFYIFVAEKKIIYEGPIKKVKRKIIPKKYYLKKKRII